MEDGRWRWKKSMRDGWRMKDEGWRLKREDVGRKKMEDGTWRI